MFPDKILCAMNGYGYVVYCDEYVFRGTKYL